jgi:hypothetical protein
MHPRGLARDTCCDRWLVLASCCLMARSTVADRLHRLPSATSVPHCLVAIAIECIGLERDKTEAMYSLRYRVVLLTLMAYVASTGTGQTVALTMEFRTRICPWWISPLQSASHPNLQSATSNAGTSLTVSCVFLMRRLPADRRLKSPMRYPNKSQCRICLPTSPKTFRSFRAINS